MRHIRNSISIMPLASVILASAILLSACGGSGGSGGSGSSNNDEQTDFITKSVPDTQTDTSLGTIFSANNGLSLYTFENDRPGVSNCNDQCADTWPPVFATDDAQASGDFSIIERADGRLQWAFKDYPLYFYHLDKKSGDTRGEDIKNVWFVARPDPWKEVTVNDTTSGLIFAGKGSVIDVDENGLQAQTRQDREGITLYTFKADDADSGKSKCNGKCANVWPPLYADKGARASGNFNIITRDDGSLQWAFKNYPVYFFIEDETTPGTTAGHGVLRAGDLWYVARPDPLKIVNNETIGSLFVGKGEILDVNTDGSQANTRITRDGVSLYTFDQDVANSSTSNCNGKCANVWPPLYAEEGAKQKQGSPLSLVTRDDNTLQWAYNGRPLYFFKSDNNLAGLTNGDNAPGAGGLWYAARNAPVRRAPDVTVRSEILDILIAQGEISDVGNDGKKQSSKTDKTGFTLYTFDDDIANSGVSTCTEVSTCAQTWPPLYADASDVPGGDFSIITRNDNSLQWTFKGKPLYFYVGDNLPGDLNGVYTTWRIVSPGTNP